RLRVPYPRRGPHRAAASREEAARCWRVDLDLCVGPDDRPALLQQPLGAAPPCIDRNSRQLARLVVRSDARVVRHPLLWPDRRLAVVRRRSPDSRTQLHGLSDSALETGLRVEGEGERPNGTSNPVRCAIFSPLAPLPSTLLFRRDCRFAQTSLPPC